MPAKKCLKPEMLWEKLIIRLYTVGTRREITTLFKDWKHRNMQQYIIITLNYSSYKIYYYNYYNNLYTSSFAIQLATIHTDI